MLRSFLAGLLFVALAVAGVEADARYRDWRDAVKAGDYPAAYEDLFQAWRNGTPEPRAQALRNAWRNPNIVAVARQDFLRRLQPIVDAHTGDLASLRKAVRKGPIEDRVDFAAVVDRKLEVDREIERAFAAKGQGKGAASAPTVPAPALKTLPPMSAAASDSAAAPVARAPASPGSVSPAPAPALTLTSPTPPSPTPPSPTPPAPTPPAPTPPSPWSLNLPGVDPGAVERATRSDLPPEVEAAKVRAVWRCQGAAECDRGWAAAESFVLNNANMRIRTAKPPLIETYPPITPGEIGLRVDRVDLGAGAEELRLTVACRAAKLRQACTTAELRIYPAFPAFLKSSR